MLKFKTTLTNAEGQNNPYKLTYSVPTSKTKCTLFPWYKPMKVCIEKIESI